MLTIVPSKEAGQNAMVTWFKPKQYR